MPWSSDIWRIHVSGRIDMIGGGPRRNAAMSCFSGSRAAAQGRWRDCRAGITRCGVACLQMQENYRGLDLDIVGRLAIAVALGRCRPHRESARRRFDDVKEQMSNTIIPSVAIGKQFPVGFL